MLSRFAKSIPASAKVLCTPRRSMSSSVLNVSEEVQFALKSGKPVVALESTIVSHGMPYPQNVETALEVENILRNHNVTPACVAIMDGKIQVGLSAEQLEKLGKTGQKAVKTSRRDISYVLSNKSTIGATTVSGTMIAAHMANIPLFVTGGIGGVHRNAQQTFDISADLTELGRTPVTVVCAGAKSILDIPLTLEYLETQGVPTVTLGPTSDFPAFFSPKSGHRSTIALPTEQECASMIYSHLQSGLNNGIVIGVPIPEAYASETQLIENALDAALKESVEKQISGKDTTPFLLQRINELTRGVSLKANIALVKNNAAKGAQIAVHLSNLVKSNPAVKSKETNFFVSKTIPATAAASTTDSSSNSLNTPTTDSISSALTQSAATPIHHLHASEQPNNAASPASSNSLVVIGGSMIDVLSNITSSKSVMYSSNIAFVTQSFGGVGRNIAECAARLGLDTHLISAVGAKDMFSESLLAHANSVGVKTEHVARLDGFSAGVYNAVFDHQGGLIIGATDATAIENLPASNIVNSLDALFETTLSASSSASTSSESSAPSDSSSAESSSAESSSKTSLNKTPVFASPFRFDQSLATQPGRKQMLVCLDGNLSFEQLQAVNKKVLEQRESSGDPNSVLVWFEPTSVTKANKITPILPCINFASPNELELEELDTILHQIYVKQTSAASSSSSSSSTKKSGFFSSVFSSSSSSSSSSAPAKSSSKSPSVNLHIWSSMSTELQIMVQRAVRVSEWIPNLIVSIGADGKIVLIREGSNVHVKHYPANYGWCVQEHELASELVLQKQSKQQQETAAKDNTNTATTTTTTKEKGKDKEFVSSNISLSDLKDKPEADEEYEEIDLPIVNVTGAGDSSVAGIITTLLSNKSIDDAIKVGMRCSRLSLMSPKAISERVSPTLLLMKDIETQSLSSIL